MSTTEVSTPPARERLIVQDNSAISYLMDSAKFEHCYRIASLMAKASLIPDHLRMDMKSKQLLPIEQVQGNCFMIVNQSLRWGFDPFAVAPETYIVGGKLAYQGKLVAAAVNALGGLVGDLEYTFSGKPGTDDFMITVSGQKVGEDKPRTVTVTVGQAKTDNQMWKKDPEQKLVYTGSVKWARRHTPGVIMGIMIQEDLEEIEMRDVTPRNEPTTTKVITGGGAKTAAAKADKPAAVEAVADSGEALPTRDEMTKAIKARMKSPKIGLPVAEGRCREAGLLKAGQTFQGTTDTELFAIYQNLDVINPPEAEAATEAPAPAELTSVRGIYQNHAVKQSPEGAERKWTIHTLRYTLEGAQDIREAVSFSSTVGDFLDTLEGGEMLMLHLASGEKGDQIKGVELANNGGDQ